MGYSVLVVFNNFLLIDVTDRSKISSDQKRFFIALCLYPLSFFANTPLKKNGIVKFSKKKSRKPMKLSCSFLEQMFVVRECGLSNSRENKNNDYDWFLV